MKKTVDLLHRIPRTEGRPPKRGKNRLLSRFRSSWRLKGKDLKRTKGECVMCAVIRERTGIRKRGKRALLTSFRDNWYL